VGLPEYIKYNAYGSKYLRGPLVSKEFSILQQKLLPYLNLGSSKAVAQHMGYCTLLDTPFIRTACCKMEVVFDVLTTNVTDIRTSYLRLLTMQSSPVWNIIYQYSLPLGLSRRKSATLFEKLPLLITLEIYLGQLKKDL
jgi:hypothetical protein